MCESIASELKLSQEEIRKIKIAGLMHDIGKIAIDGNLFNKPGKLSSEDWVVVKRHPEIGYRILNSVDEFKDVGRFVLEHHEKWNGSGYPKGLKENEISLQAKIIAIANSFDLMTSERPYKKTLTVEETANELERNAGIKFDPFVVKIFVDNVLKKIQKN
jgi:HD-GYP domain-containing protein (c-di-GMP phosphodiesterase class II)